MREYLVATLLLSPDATPLGAVSKNPVAICRAHTRSRIALNGVVEVGKFQRIAQEKYRRVVANQVPVARVGVKLHRKATNIALGIGGTTLTCNGREAYEAVGFLAYGRENRGSRVLCNIVCHGECAIRSRPFGVHTPFGYNLSVEVG